MTLRTDYANAITETCGTLGGCVSLLMEYNEADFSDAAFRDFATLQEAADKFADRTVTASGGRKILAAFLREMLARLEGKPC